MDKRTIRKALASLEAVRAEYDSMWDDDRRALDHAVTVLRRYDS